MPGGMYLDSSLILWVLLFPAYLVAWAFIALCCGPKTREPYRWAVAALLNGFMLLLADWAGLVSLGWFVRWAAPGVAAAVVGAVPLSVRAAVGLPLLVLAFASPVLAAVSASRSQGALCVMFGQVRWSLALSVLVTTSVLLDSRNNTPWDLKRTFGLALFAATVAGVGWWANQLRAPSARALPLLRDPLLLRTEATRLDLAGARCRVCGEAVDPASVVVCRDCGTPHHEACFAYAGRCAIFGCGCDRMREAPGGPGASRVRAATA